MLRVVGRTKSPLKDALVLIPGNWDYVTLHAEGSKVADTIKMAYQLTLRWKDLLAGQLQSQASFKAGHISGLWFREGYGDGRRVGGRLSCLL